ncbi:hypothetical protein IL38_24010 [Actinopolyspora erythraea]|uniref:Uncharacterized protein n=1 Tax=Actinopolyspora erythraea TaxID=414996 RepID=A0ABR4WYG1_9ACTN|nr:hypothetical protein [Actinopolyspora erythraea]KGI79366.1 hypothetical protein IL38_24010 [Actinopolyspora erythraea]
MSPSRAKNDVPESVAAANALRGTLTGEPPFLPTMSEEQKKIELLSYGSKLQLWHYRTMTNDRNFIVQINGRNRLLDKTEVFGWILGVLDAVSLEVTEFAYRSGLE